MHFSYRPILSTLILGFGLAFILPNVLVLAQSRENEADAIQNQIFNNKQIKNYCENVDADIEFELDGDQLQIITGNHQCSYKIVQEVLEPQLKQGKIKTYEFIGGQEDLIVSF